MFFRIIKNNKVIISSEDMYHCSDKYDCEVFNLDVPGESVFDESLSKHYDDLSSCAIIQADINEVGDLEISFENNFLLQVYISTSKHL